MYFNVYGGSALLHLLAAHPRIVAAFGIVASVAMLASPLGQGDYPGLARYAKTLDRVVARSAAVDNATIIAATLAADRFESMPHEVVDAAVRVVLSECSSHCAELTPAIVEGDAKLLRKALLVYELDLMAKNRGAEQPRVIADISHGE